MAEQASHSTKDRVKTFFTAGAAVIAVLSGTTAILKWVNIGPSPGWWRTLASSPSHLAAAAGPFIAPADVTAVSRDSYAIRVNWADAAMGVTGFDVSNGCAPSACGPGGSLVEAAGRSATSATFEVTPGSHQCFRVRALSRAGNSPWSAAACTRTPGFILPGNVQWAPAGVTVPAGTTLTIAATGSINFGANTAGSTSPDGDPGCDSSLTIPVLGVPYTAPGLTCYSLIARIGGAGASPIPVGASRTFTTTAAGPLYLSANDSNFTDNTGFWTVTIQVG